MFPFSNFGNKSLQIDHSRVRTSRLPGKLFSNVPFPASFFSSFSSLQHSWSKRSIPLKKFANGFELRTFGVRSNRSTNWPTTTTQDRKACSLEIKNILFLNLKSLITHLSHVPCHRSYTDKIFSRPTLWAPNGCQSEMWLVPVSLLRGYLDVAMVVRLGWVRVA